MIDNFTGASNYEREFAKRWREACAEVKKGLRIEEKPVPSKKLKEAEGYYEGYAALGNAVVITAVKDWRTAVRCLRRNPNHKTAQRALLECEAFFTDEYFNTFTNIDGRGMLENLIREESTTYRLATREIRRED